MDTAYGIFQYNTNNFSAYISYQTDTSLSTIKQKPQITYLDNYITKLAKNKQVVFIYENEYIDKHYLDDYATYYVKCFSTYRKTTSRIHFFQVEDPKLNYKEEFKKALNGDKTFITSDNYLGYIVIRPIPQTFLAEICLKAYTNESYKYMILKNYKISLFGIELQIKSVAFQEQDKILSACATTALWTFFHAHPRQNQATLPSASAITKSAYSEKNGYNREFPNTGLSTEMICRSLRVNNLAPEYFEFSKEKNFLDDKTRINLLKEYIYAYISSGLPLILGVLVQEESKVDNCQQGNCQNVSEKGLHAVTILGYAKENTDERLVSHGINKLYVHDDRYGPFMKMDFDNESFNVSLQANKSVTNVSNFKDEIYSPDTLIVGVYHKIRIPYLRIKYSGIDLQDSLVKYLKKMGKDEHAEIISKFQWDIQLKENNKLKKEILNSNIKMKEMYLTKSLPKYLWSARVILMGKVIFEMIFDATDIDHGNVFLDIIPIDCDYSSSMISIIKSYSKDHFNNKLQLDSKIRSHDNYMWGIIKFFKEKESYQNSLSELYGYLKIPTRIKNEEIDQDTIINQCDIRLNQENNYNDFNFIKNAEEEGFQYLWVIDIDGFLCIGKQYNKTELGHPTLTEGMPARIGGEFHYDKKREIWEVDPFSGRYSGEYSNHEKRAYVKNVIKYKLNVYFPKETWVLKDYEDRD